MFCLGAHLCFMKKILLCIYESLWITIFELGLLWTEAVSFTEFRYTLKEKSFCMCSQCCG